jgi:hypothetical protein
VDRLGWDGLVVTDNPEGAWRAALEAAFTRWTEVGVYERRPGPAVPAKTYRLYLGEGLRHWPLPPGLLSPPAGTGSNLGGLSD